VPAQVCWFVECFVESADAKGMMPDRWQIEVLSPRNREIAVRSIVWTANASAQQMLQLSNWIEDSSEVI
jgi:hypothetical protein